MTPLPVFEPTHPREPVTWVRAHGIELLLPAADQVVTPYLQRKREWDGVLASAVLDAMSVGRTFLDVGAMVGYFSCLVAKHHPGSRVIAVEPMPENLALASANLAVFPHATLLAGAVSNAPDAAWSLVPDASNRGNTRIAAVAAAPAAPGSAVPTATLGALVTHYGVDTVKIDVQGMEKDVLDSLDLTARLPRDLTLFCEFTPEMWAGEEAIAAVVHRFEAAGFAAYLLSETRAYTAFGTERLSRRIRAGSSWSDHFELALTRGRYADTIASRS